MSEDHRIYPNFNPNGPRSASFPDCHWRLCRQFMDRYQSTLPAEQLYALAHIFANTQLLLRGDTDQTMALVLDLVRDPAVEVDQVENAARCREREAEPEVLESMEALDISTEEVIVKQEPEEMVEESVPEAMVEESVPEERGLDSFSAETKVTETGKIETCSNIEMNQTQTPEESKNIVPEPTLEVPTKFIRVVPPTAPVPLETLYQNLVLFDDNFEKTQSHFNRLNCGKLEMIVKQHADLQHSAMVKIDRQVLVHATGKKRPDALARASKMFFGTMRDHCYRIETLPFQKILQTTPNVVQRETTAQSPQQRPSPDERINESNVGFRMLQKIGWTGGPLGASAQGRLDPVECSTVRKGRAGIGAVVPDQLDVAHYRKVMREFQGRKDGCYLVFSAEFTNGERSELNNIACQLRLDCRVFTLPKGVKHFVVMARELPPQEIIRRIVIEKHAGLSAQYRVLPPKKSASFSNANLLPEEVSDCPSDPESEKVDDAKLEEGDNDSQASSDEEGSPVDDQILSSLTRFKPVRPLLSVEDVYHNLVIIRNSFKKTMREFSKTGVGKMKLQYKRLPEGVFFARIYTDQFVLAEAYDPIRNKAGQAVKAAFLSKCAMFCYRLKPKTSKKNMDNAIARTQSPEADPKYYKNIIKNFSKDCFERELVFSAEFSRTERIILQRIAQSLNLRVAACGSRNRRHLRISGKPLPALVILERIVVQKDPVLSQRYDVTPPRIGVRLDGGL